MPPPPSSTASPPPTNPAIVPAPSLVSASPAMPARPSLGAITATLPSPSLLHNSLGLRLLTLERRRPPQRTSSDLVDDNKRRWNQDWSRRRVLPLGSSPRARRDTSTLLELEHTVVVREDECRCRRRPPPSTSSFSRSLPPSRPPLHIFSTFDLVIQWDRVPRQMITWLWYCRGLGRLCMVVSGICEDGGDVVMVVGLETGLMGQCRNWAYGPGETRLMGQCRTELMGQVKLDLWASVETGLMGQCRNWAYGPV
ncbi:hypothetical protein V8G54_024485 [Vigna mungo]|uniref:Uncharacterized protein n=1 Tax=Vigna mungo TaxID=3915 RepID=A0AAQ3RT91_VIGMU